MVAKNGLALVSKNGMRTHITEDYRIERGWRNVVWPAGSLWGSGERNARGIYNREVCEQEKN